MNWIKKFNELDKLYTDEILDIFCEHEKLKENILDNTYREAYKLEYDIDSLDIISLKSDELADKILLLMNTYKEISDRFNCHVEDIRKDFELKCERIQGYQDKFLNNAGIYMRSEKDGVMFFKRLQVFCRKTVEIVLSLNIDVLADMKIMKNIKTDLEFLNNFAIKKLKKDSEELLNFTHIRNKNKLKYNKIFNYKELCDLAKSNNYKQVRVTGDHLIYKHDKTNKIVPIPANNELHFGIMRNIQKMIQVNSL